MRESSENRYPTEVPSLASLQKTVFETAAGDLPGHFLPGMDQLTEARLQVPPENAVQAAVTLLVHNSEGIPSILFIERSHRFGPVAHRGQIAFPGGKKENDETLKYCAFRETEEEIGVSFPPDHPAKPLTPLYIPVSNFLIQPFVTFRESLPQFSPNPAEVVRIIDSPLIDLEARYPVLHRDITVQERTLHNVPYFPLQGKILWGASALIFSEFLQIIREDT